MRTQEQQEAWDNLAITTYLRVQDTHQISLQELDRGLGWIDFVNRETMELETRYLFRVSPHTPISYDVWSGTAPEEGSIEEAIYKQLAHGMLDEYLWVAYEANGHDEEYRAFLSAASDALEELDWSDEEM